MASDSGGGGTTYLPGCRRGSASSKKKKRKIEGKVREMSKPILSFVSFFPVNAYLHRLTHWEIVMPGTKFVAPPRSARVPYRRDIGFNLEHPTHLSFLFGKIIVAPRRTGDKKKSPLSAITSEN